MIKLKRALIILALFALMINSAMAVNLLTNGDFEAGSAGWTDIFPSSYLRTFAESWTYTANNIPAGYTTGNFYNGQGASTTAGVNGGNIIYQSVTLEAGKNYILSGAISSYAGTNCWCEFYLLNFEPTTAIDIDPINFNYQSSMLASLKEDPWDSVGAWNAYNGTIEGLPALNYPAIGPNFNRALPISTSGTYYFVVNFGSTNIKAYNISLDNLSLDETTLPVELSIFSAE